ncbi:MAG: MBL fold metallo-hydrolase, partial [Treponema sp.]|nr:MBL fold metallo-hydrolase [Treponema sp.]
MRASSILPLLFPLAIFAACASQQPPPNFDEEAWLERVNNADPSLLYGLHQNEEGNYFNPWMPRSLERRKGRHGFFFREKMSFEEFPEELYGPVENNYDYLADPAFNSFSFFGHASFIIKIDGVTILTDPFFSKRALIIGKKVKNPIDFSKLPRQPIVLISHNHYDHLDAWTVKRLIKKDSVFIVPMGLKDFFVKKGAKEVYELDWWQKVTIGTIQYTLLPAQHWSRRIGQAGGRTLWGSF